MIVIPQEIVYTIIWKLCIDLSGKHGEKGNVNQNGGKQYMDKIKAYIMSSHDKIETIPRRNDYLIDKDRNYDLYDIRQKKIVKTVKGATILRNVKAKKYKVSNLIPPDYQIYVYSCCDNRRYIPETIGIADFRCGEAKVTDIKLNGLNFLGKRIKNNHVAISVGYDVLDFMWETQVFNPLNAPMGFPCEENILNITSGNRLIKRHNLGYNGRIETIELRKLDGELQLRLNIKEDESGPSGGHPHIDMPVTSSLKDPISHQKE